MRYFKSSDKLKECLIVLDVHKIGQIFFIHGDCLQRSLNVEEKLMEQEENLKENRKNSPASGSAPEPHNNRNFHYLHNFRQDFSQNNRLRFGKLV